MKLTDISWIKAEEYFKENDIVLLSVGSVESHGRHMPLGTDTIIPMYLLDKIEEKSNVLIAPTIPFGCTDELENYSGTVNISANALYLYISDVVNSLYNHGARKFVFLNGHGGNCKVLNNIGYDLDKKGAVCAVLNWWLMAWDLNPKWKGGHGGAEETSAILGINPDLVDRNQMGEEANFENLTPEIKFNGFRSATYKGVKIDITRRIDRITDTGGWVGADHPKNATEEWGKEMLSATADYIVDFLEEFKKVEI